MTKQIELFGQMPATFVCIGENGAVQLVAKEFDKNKFADDCRALCVAENTSVAVFACEARLCRKEEFERGETPKKVISVRLELAGGASDFHFYRIMRQCSGHAKLGPRAIYSKDVAAGDFTNFLPLGKPDNIDRIFAAAYFQNDPRVTRFN